jgi:hypothetical protein
MGALAREFAYQMDEMGVASALCWRIVEASYCEKEIAVLANG